MWEEPEELSAERSAERLTGALTDRRRQVCGPKELLTHHPSWSESEAQRTCLAVTAEALVDEG